MTMRHGSIALEADANDPEDFPVGQAALDRAQMARRIRRLRHRLGLTQVGFAERYGIPESAIRQYEIARTMPPPAVRAYLTVIEREPEMTARALHPEAVVETMKRDEAVARLRAHRKQLEDAGVRHAAIFGSVARGDNRPDSDVDVLVEVDAGRVRSLFDLGHIHSLVEEIIGGPVDVARRDRLRPHVAIEAERDAVDAF